MADADAPVCIDTNLWIYALIGPSSPVTQKLDDLIIANRLVAAPSCIHEEFCHAVRKYALGGRIPGERAMAAASTFLNLPMSLVDDNELHMAALSMSLEIPGLSAYDAHFVAVAQRAGAELWTADKQLARIAELLGVPTRLWTAA